MSCGQLSDCLTTVVQLNTIQFLNFSIIDRVKSSYCLYVVDIIIVTEKVYVKIANL